MDKLPDPAAAMPHLSAFWAQALDIWRSGGWAMIAIAVVAMVLFGMATHIYLRLARKGFTSVGEKKWRRWINHPELRRGPIGELLDFVMGASNTKDLEIFFQELQVGEIAPFERDLRVLKRCVTAAPLLGLLGTVTGMLTTFAALSTGSGGDQTMEMVASGISEALITTQTGLVIALPGLFIQYQLGRKLDKYRAFLAHLESVCAQKLHRKLHLQETHSTTLVPRL